MGPQLSTGLTTAGGLSSWTEWLRVVADLTRARTLPSWCIIHKRFNLSQADFSKRWCLGDVLAQVSSDGSGLPLFLCACAYCDPSASRACCFGGGCCFSGAGGSTLDSRLSRFMFAL